MCMGTVATGVSQRNNRSIFSRMVSVAGVFAWNVARAAGYELREDGALLFNGKSVYRIATNGDMITAPNYYELLLWILDRCPDRTALAVRHAETLDIDELGVLGLACKSATTLGGTLRRLERYFQILAETLQYRLSTSEKSVFLEQRMLVPVNHAVVITREGGLGAILMIMRTIAGADISPRLVQFQHNPPERIDLLETFFGCPVSFGEERTGMEFGPEVLSVPNILGDNAMSAYLDAQLDAAVAELAPKETIETRTKDAICRVLSEGTPHMSEIAGYLGMSARSFSRRLSERGVSFQVLADRARHELAESLLVDEQNSLAEVAFLTGFSEQSSFTRAFKRWAGVTPASFRKGQAGA